MLTFAPKKVFTHFCPDCGMALAEGEECQRRHKEKTQRIGRYSGKSDSPNRYNNYQ